MLHTTCIYHQHLLNPDYMYVNTGIDIDLMLVKIQVYIFIVVQYSYHSILRHPAVYLEY